MLIQGVGPSRSYEAYMPYTLVNHGHTYSCVMNVNVKLRFIHVVDVAVAGQQTSTLVTGCST